MNIQNTLANNTSRSTPRHAGPDEVVDDFDNGRANDGPDAIVDEFDNSRSRSGDYGYSNSYESYGYGGGDYIGGMFIG